MKKSFASIMALVLAFLVCFSSLALSAFAEEEETEGSVLITPTDLWSQTTQNAECTTVTQKNDGVQISIGSYGAGENNFVDWVGDLDSIGPGFVDYSKPVSFSFTINSLDLKGDAYGPWTNIWCGFISLGAGKYFSLNITPATNEDSSMNPNAVFIYLGDLLGNHVTTTTPVPFAGTTFFVNVDLKNKKLEVGTSSSPDTAPTEMTNILPEGSHGQIPTDDDDLVGNFFTRHNITGNIEMVYTMHEFQGTSMIPATVEAKSGTGATVNGLDITFDAKNKKLTVADLLDALKIEGGAVRILDGATQIDEDEELIKNLIIEVKNGAIVNLYTVTVNNLPVPPSSSTPTSSPSSQVPITDTSDNNMIGLVMVILTLVCSSAVLVNKRRILGK